MFWVGFGLYGIYTFYGVIRYHGPSPAKLLHPVQDPEQVGNYNGEVFNGGIRRTTSAHNPNEIVIRIVKEVVHIREDGSNLEKEQNSGTEEPIGFSKEEVEQILECIAAKQ
jgi:hypothetical protein